MDVKGIIILVLVLTSSLALDNSTLTDMYIQVSSDVGTLRNRTDVIEQQLISMTSSLGYQGESIQQMVILYEQNVVPNFLSESLLRLFVVGVVLLNLGFNAMLVIYLANVVKQFGKQISNDKTAELLIPKKDLHPITPVQKTGLLDKLKNVFNGKQSNHETPQQLHTKVQPSSVQNSTQGSKTKKKKEVKFK